ncbi:uncharacterized protein BDW70DRAFT_147265 [Aspergillus foveolatus]|uniref:uncharacterized protein n=1 Tax=Aspergillus foveolatus TaxID=210207 RepID=UPI003CCD4E8C
MDTFTRLPPELIVQIILHLADFSAVQNLLSASESVRAVFGAQPIIIQGLIRSDSIASLPEIQKLCLNTALLQTSSSLPQSRSLLDYQQKYGDNPTIEYTEELSTCILDLAARAQRLACVCASLIQHKMVSALAQCENPKISNPDRIQRASEPLSFAEEYRIYCSIWHLQHYSTPRKAATERWNWDEASLQDWRTGTERIWTTAALLSDLEGEESSRVAWTFPHETPLPLFSSFDMPPAQHTSNPSRLWTPLPPPRKTEATDTRRLTAERRGSPPLQCTRERRPSSPALVDFRQWRRLGVAIWDTWGLEEEARVPLVDYVGRWLALIKVKRAREYTHES